jgi:hypothetical protein
VQEVKQAASTTTTPMWRPVSQQTPRSLTGRPPSGPSTLLACATRVSHTPRPHQRDIQTRPAAQPGTSAPYSGARLPSTTAPPPHPSQPAPGTPNGRQLSGLFAIPLAPLTHISHMRISAAHKRAIQMRQQHGCGPVACHIGACTPIIESRHIAAMYGSKEASCPPYFTCIHLRTQICHTK